MYLCVRECLHVLIVACLWRSEDTLEVLVLSCYVGPGVQARVWWQAPIVLSLVLIHFHTFLVA